MQPLSLRKSILLPLIASGLAVFMAGTVFVKYVEEHQKDDVLRLESAAMQKHLHSALNDKAEVMAASLHFLVQDKQLIAALRDSNRQNLLALATPIYERLHRENNITHFYFHDAHRINLLRVHKPERYGDTINRFTALGAEKSGELFSGIELGPLGTFTLRSVLPVFESGKLLGYIELGQEIDGIIKETSTMFQVELFMLIDKRYLSKRAWEDGMRMLGRPFDWDLLPDSVLVSQSIPEIPVGLLSSMINAINKSSGIAIGKDVELQGQEYWVSGFTMQDAGDRPVARVIMLRDTTEFMGNTRSEWLRFLAVSIALSVVILILFYFILGRTERRLKIQHALDTILSLSLTPLSLREVMSASLDAILSIPGFELLKQGAIFLAAKDEQTLEMAVQRNLPDSLQKSCGRLPFGRCLCGKAAASREIVFTNRLNEQHEITYDGIQPHGHYCVPIMLEGKLLGVLNIYVAAGYVARNRDRESLKTLADTLGVVIGRKRADENLERMAYNDALTGLANRALFYDRMQQAIALGQRHERNFALMYLDLDCFKEINDIYGHHMGDVMLREAAVRLLGCVRQLDTVARMGGDEFTVILTETGTPEHVEFVAKNILRALAEPFVLGKATPTVSISIGIAIYPTHGKDSETLISNADAAMYFAKKQRSTFCFFSEKLQSDL